MSKRSYNSEDDIGNILKFVDEEEDDFDDDLQDLVGNDGIDINELENEDMILQLLYFSFMMFCFIFTIIIQRRLFSDSTFSLYRSGLGSIPVLGQSEIRHSILMRYQSSMSAHLKPLSDCTLVTTS